MTTSKQLLQNILDSINSSLVKKDLSDDARSAIIEQYGRTADFLKAGYDYLDVNTGDLPTIIRDETISLFNDALEAFKADMENIEKDASILVSNKIAEVDKILTAFESDSKELKDSLSASVAKSVAILKDQELLEALNTNVVLGNLILDTRKIAEKIKIGG